MFAMLFLFLMFAGGLWLFSVNEFKVPPARVVPVPEGFEVIGGDTDGGSGGTTIRWIYIAAPEGLSIEVGVEQLVAAMVAEGWERSIPPGRVRRGELAFMGRNDEWAGLSSSAAIDRGLLDLDAIAEEARREFIVVELTYTDMGAGRRCLVCN